MRTGAVGPGASVGLAGRALKGGGDGRVVRVREDLQGIPRTLVLSRPEPEGDSDG